ncbi:hypothetical protein I5462_12555 [Citrobacter freundii]|uniref:DNA methyltransferase n=1 Tax=Citrobacter freundii TaxID=546 RepID=UPI000C801B80|nr:DNA methyltransferase [Citrobacter freundii]EMB4337255.1 hypothetical protein [Citrobacter freundii]MBJ9041901.1 hypothetical protein [Citrobacter freundii]NTY76599.1 site-specific DNA-methyltransferase [Citrobacter freundii]NUA13047.1 site-specific DNA-methyltransferase [Citrobacter freundii]PMD03477.1 hypothetical protein CJ200_02140 [Citrobacter freundii]
MFTSFDEWINQRKIASWGTNFGTSQIAFQGWRHFKEAYVPELIKRAIDESKITVTNCLDPFGGSGTTALACQFLGIHPSTIEVNPYLADLIEAKLSTYNIHALVDDFGFVVKTSYDDIIGFEEYINYLPPTFIEPGVNNRWIFNLDVAKRVYAIISAIKKLDNPVNARLFKVLLGGILVEVSNAIVNGKGRRYRNNWSNRLIEKMKVDELFQSSVKRAISDISKYSNRKCLSFEILRGDSRELIPSVKNIELCVFSPPYPNSFDYTDVYNIELWTLQYLNSQSDNKLLREKTLTSHVQVQRSYSSYPEGSDLLNETIINLENLKKTLWNKNIPAMVGAYFTDMKLVIDEVFEKLSPKGEIWMVVGDSKYAGVKVSTAQIIVELMSNKGINLINYEAFRSMRTSAQQGGQKGLDETLITFRKA